MSNAVKSRILVAFCPRGCFRAECKGYAATRSRERAVSEGKTCRECGTPVDAYIATVSAPSSVPDATGN